MDNLRRRLAGITSLNKSAHKKPRHLGGVFKKLNYARTILFALMHEVQTLRRLGVLFTNARTDWMFGLNRRFVRRCECEILWPKPGPLPQTSHVAATLTP